MDELENFECFGVPHAGTAAAELAALVIPPRQVWRPPLDNLDGLGIEAIPSPALSEFGFGR